MNTTISHKIVCLFLALSLMIFAPGCSLLGGLIGGDDNGDGTSLFDRLLSEDFIKQVERIIDILARFGVIDTDDKDALVQSLLVNNVSAADLQSLSEDDIRELAKNPNADTLTHMVLAKRLGVAGQRKRAYNNAKDAVNLFNSPDFKSILLSARTDESNEERILLAKDALVTYLGMEPETTLEKHLTTKAINTIFNFVEGQFPNVNTAATSGIKSARETIKHGDTPRRTMQLARDLAEEFIPKTILTKNSSSGLIENN